MAEVKKQILRIIPFSLIVLSIYPVAYSKIIYVDDDAVGANDGSSWTNAYMFLQDALADANSVEKPVEIRIAQGIYRPDQGENQTLGNREATFHLINGVSLKGGFAGSINNDPNIRDVTVYETILTGDIDDDDLSAFFPESIDDNSYHVITSTQTDLNTLLDGLIVTAGRGTGDGVEVPTFGAGLYNFQGQLTLSDCTFSGNLAEGGGGIFNDGGVLELIRCRFISNSATDGGGMYDSGGGQSLLSECIFKNNHAQNKGAGLFCEQSNFTVSRCIFADNKAGGPYLGNSGTYWWQAGKGGAVYNSGGKPVFNECTFTLNIATQGGGMFNGEQGAANLSSCVFNQNTARRAIAELNEGINPCGGGLYNDNSNPILNGCLFEKNEAEQITSINPNTQPYSGMGGGIFNMESSPQLINCTMSRNTGAANQSWNWPSPPIGGAIHNQQSSPTLTSCIIWDNGSSEIADEDDSMCFISYSNVKGGWEGIGNIDTDPFFAAEGYWSVGSNNQKGTFIRDSSPTWIKGDYHLKSQAGRWDPNSESWIKDEVTSLCIDTGDPNSDFSGETWPNGGRINMGAYGGTLEASMSTETGGMSLPQVAYIFSNRVQEAEDFGSLLEAYGCSTTLIRLNDVKETPLDSYDILIVANDTQHDNTWNDPNTISSIEDPNKPVVGLGDGGYDFFGLLGLWVGNPNGGHGSKNSIEVVDPNSSLLSTPYSIEIPENLILQLYTETNHVGLYLWPSIPESVTVFGREGSSVNYFPLAMEFNQYLLWGFNGSPQDMTEVGKTLFINVVIWTANKAWESES